MRSSRWVTLAIHKANQIVKSKVTNLKVFRKMVKLQKITCQLTSIVKMEASTMLAAAVSPITA